MRLVPQCGMEPYRTPLNLLSPRGFVDLEADALGRIYLSETEAGEAARMFGYANPDEHSQVVAERDELRARVAELEADIAELIPVRDFISKYGDRADDEPVRPKRKAA